MTTTTLNRRLDRIEESAAIASRGYESLSPEELRLCWSVLLKAVHNEPLDADEQRMRAWMDSLPPDPTFATMTPDQMLARWQALREQMAAITTGVL